MTISTAMTSLNNRGISMLAKALTYMDDSKDTGDNISNRIHRNVMQVISIITLILNYLETNFYF